MYLEITPHGSKLWRMKYRFLGKENRLSFGVYPETSLSEARQKRDAARKTLKSDIDPAQARQEEKRRRIEVSQNTFKAIALEWHENQKERWSESYARKIMLGLELNVFPYLGNRPLAAITPPELLECLRRIEKRGSLDISGRTKQICGAVFRYGIQTGRCERDAAADLRGALKTRKTEHFRTIDLKQLPVLLGALERNEARLFERTRRAVRLSLYTFCRPVEIRKARWEDIDLEEGLWTIPAEFMKMRRDHMVPLSRQALGVLRAQYEEVKILSSPWVFPSQVHPRNPMSDGTVNKAIRNLGFGQDMVAHGVRALARTTIRENLGCEAEIIERQLAHKASGPLGEAYDRTQFLPQRKKMMQEWADFLDAAAMGGKVIRGDFEKRRA